jgi:hypothetical protein
VIGYSRDNFTGSQNCTARAEKLLQEVSRRNSLLKNGVDPTVEEAVAKMA